MAAETFENRHIHDPAYLKAYYLHTLRTVPRGLVIWSVLAAVCLLLGIRSAGRSTVLAVVYGALTVMCLLRGLLGGWIGLRESYQRACAQYGKNSWESVVELGPCIRLTDDGKKSVEIDWSNCERLDDQGSWLRLRLRGRRGELHLRKADFTVGTAQAFREWLAKTHPEIIQRG